MIYLDNSFQTLCQHQWPSIENIFSKPHKVELVAYRAYHSDLDLTIRNIEFLLQKANRVAVAITEPTDRFVLLDKTIHEKFDNVVVFANIMPNYDSKTISNITWFNGTNNPYADTQWGETLLNKLTHGSNRPKKFDCLLGRGRPERELIHGFYQQCQHKDQFIYTYHKDDIRNGVWDCDVSNISMSVESVVWDGAMPSASHIIPVNIYNDSYYSIVAETIVGNELNFFTEKIAKPLLSQRPFIVFAGQHYLSNLRKIGFQTFHDIIDESYDSEPNLQLRFHKAWQQVLFLLEQDADQVMEHCKQRLQHNQSLLLNTDWNLELKMLLDQYK